MDNYVMFTLSKSPEKNWIERGQVESNNKNKKSRISNSGPIPSFFFKHDNLKSLVYGNNFIYYLIY